MPLFVKIIIAVVAIVIISLVAAAFAAFGAASDYKLPPDDMEE
jgi:hypothetical protein